MVLNDRVTDRLEAVDDGSVLLPTQAAQSESFAPRSSLWFVI